MCALTNIVRQDAEIIKQPNITLKNVIDEKVVKPAPEVPCAAEHTK